MNNAHILGTERIGKLLVQYSIPAIIGMTITSLYNIIDSIFIGHGVGPMGIAGLAITFPLMNLVVAFCTMVSAGGSTISSIRLGQKDLDGATEVLGNTLMFCLVNAFIFGSVSFIFLDDILRFFGASNDTLPYARDFMQVILLGTPVTYTMMPIWPGHPLLHARLFHGLMNVRLRGGRGCHILLYKYSRRVTGGRLLSDYCNRQNAGFGSIQ